MVKVPAAGRVKSRLARDIGVVGAAGFYRRTAAAIVARLGGPGRPWQTVLAVAPDRGAALPLWPRGVRRAPQGRGDLGLRMQRAIERQPPGPVVLVGSDIPALRAQHIAQAFAALGGHDAVLGPAADGGYWLVGFRRRPRCPRPFAGVRWSTPSALADTLANLSGSRVALLATLGDVDTADDLAGVAGWCGRRVLPVSPGAGEGARSPSAAG